MDERLRVVEFHKRKLATAMGRRLKGPINSQEAVLVQFEIEYSRHLKEFPEFAVIWEAMSQQGRNQLLDEILAEAGIYVFGTKVPIEWN